MLGGIVPTLDDPFTVTVEAFFKRLNELWRWLFDCLRDDCESRTLPHAMGMIARKTAQEYNQREKRKETFR